MVDLEKHVKQKIKDYSMEKQEQANSLWHTIEPFEEQHAELEDELFYHKKEQQQLEQEQQKLKEEKKEMEEQIEENEKQLKEHEKTIVEITQKITDIESVISTKVNEIESIIKNGKGGSRKYKRLRKRQSKRLH